jgi:predicted TIM-barrel fold metal-dependent hydrolase
LRESLTRVLRSYRLSRGDLAAGVLSLPSIAPQKTDCDFDADAWDHGGEAALAAAGIGRVVLSRLPAIDASPLPLTEATGPDWRAVIDLPEDTRQASLLALHAWGVRGVRIDLGTGGELDGLLKFADRIVPLGWHVEIRLAAPGAARALAKAEWRLMQFPLAVCFSGLGGLRQGPRADETDLAFLLGMVQLGRYWLKLTSADLTPLQLKLWDEPSPLARVLQTVRKDRLIWGSGKQTGSDGAAHLASGLAVLEKCLPHPGDQEQVLVDNPGRLYGFDSEES